MFSSVLLVAGILISLCQRHSPPSEKNVSPTCKLLFSS
jgi:hypothetical protein